MEIKDVLKYYIGGKCQFGILVPGQPTSYEESNITIRVLHNVLAALADAKPILRPLSSMTEEEKDFIDDTFIVTPENISVSYHIIEAKRTDYLLSRHFDLFGLIESGQAIDATKTDNNV